MNLQTQTVKIILCCVFLCLHMIYLYFLQKSSYSRIYANKYDFVRYFSKKSHIKVDRSLARVDLISIIVARINTI